ncbi:hypothetical protein VSS37_03795 [Candidatus Thiothrix sp. Deng01]|uniref:Uncharacterized protein n=1 Tax=Candidatus Thiothrix phosphatis TaxID=3112415 RepID=A0ABU6CTG2_9GAMM|nr:hypothetical protein [Candidatus Thiothrix sp. Deng01]MEB4590094.1 hypothetical protein [Candidatus Thiothrix sp. Deng01]
MTIRNDILGFLEAVGDRASRIDLLATMQAMPYSHALPDIEAELTAMMADGLLDFDSVTEWYSVIAQPAVTMDDALASILCDPCPTDVPPVNEIKLHTDATGISPAQAQAGLDRIGNYVALSACSGLRTKLLAAGVPQADIDAYYGDIQASMRVLQAMVDHYADAPV